MTILLLLLLTKLGLREAGSINIVSFFKILKVPIPTQQAHSRLDSTGRIVV